MVALKVLGGVGAILILTVAANGYELCLSGGHHICCHRLCDIFEEVAPDGYSTEGAPSCRFGYPFMVSSSSADPRQDVGALSADSTLYLWLAASTGYGFYEGYTFASGEIRIREFSPSTSGVVWDPDQQRFDVHGCIYANWTLLGSMVVEIPTPVEPESWGTIKARWHRHGPEQP